jgi:phosphatidylglycerophosphatase C
LSEARLSGALAVFDLDGTITRHDTLGPYLWGYLWRRPWRVLRIVPALLAPVRYLFDRDRAALKGAAIRAILGGLQREQIERWSEQFVRQLIPAGLFAEALAAIARHRANGDRLLLMSASADLYVPRIARALGFDEVICSELRWRSDGRLDGRLMSANRRGEEKHRCLAAVMARDTPDRIYAYGNAGSDLAHMALAHEAYLVNGPARLANASTAPVHSVRWQQRAQSH